MTILNTQAFDPRTVFVVFGGAYVDQAEFLLERGHLWLNKMSSRARDMSFRSEKYRRSRFDLSFFFANESVSSHDVLAVVELIEDHHGEWLGIADCWRCIVVLGLPADLALACLERSGYRVRVVGGEYVEITYDDRC